MIKIGDKVIDQKTAEIGIVDCQSPDRELSWVKRSDGNVWVTDTCNLETYKDDININDVVNRNSFESLCQSMIEVHKAKQHDYGDAFTKSIDKYGNVAFLTRASDKFGRAETLLMGEQAQVKDEKVTDTLMDLANYCVMMVEYLKNKTN